MYVANVGTESDHRAVHDLGLKMGEYFQLKNDYTDLYVDPEVFD
jgi:geranylgeranyl pyrophosphate synthase